MPESADKVIALLTQEKASIEYWLEIAVSRRSSCSPLISWLLVDVLSSGRGAKVLRNSK